MRSLLGPTYLNVVALVAVAGLLAAAYLFVSDPLVRYGVWLLVFAIWMAWFVVIAREWISRADF